MFEVNLFTPAQFGAFIPWLVINRGPLSVLIHPNTVNPVTGEHDEGERDHTQRATWMGTPVLCKWQEFWGSEVGEMLTRGMCSGFEFVQGV
jgi:aromatic ring-cleaving dioxygenase